MPHCKSTLPDLSLKIIDAGRLQLLNIIGAGAYGTVYRARDRTGPTVPPVFYAVKVQPLEERRTFRGTYQLREINFHNAAASHPNVLSMHGVVQDDKYLYIILDFCPGGDLFNLVAHSHDMGRNNELIRSLFIQLIDAVQSCHEKNIYHRDLKPENILLNKERNQLYVSDFGLSTRNDRSDSFGAGSSYYMSPECVNSKGDLRSYDPRRSDIWSLGIILINMISGRNPWSRATHTDVCFRSFIENEEFLRTMLPLSRNANRIIRRILTIDPLTRIELPALRRLIEEVDTFIMTEAEVAVSSHHVKDAWKRYIPHQHIVPIEHVIILDDDSWVDTDSSYDFESRFPGSTALIFSGAAFHPTHASQFMTAPDVFQLVGEDSLSAYSDELSSKGVLPSTRTETLPPAPLGAELTTFYESLDSQSDESDGPYTPKTYAQDAAGVIVPEVSQGVDLGEALVSPIDLLGKKARSTSGVDAMQRFVNGLLAI